MAFMRAELKASAKEQLQGRWGTAIGAMILVYLVTFFATGNFIFIARCGDFFGNDTFSMVGVLGSFVISLLLYPLVFGVFRFYVLIMRGEDATVTTPFQGYRRFGPAVILGILTYIFVALWSLLLIIPGIIKAYSYAMSYYIMIDDENIAPIDAITKSREMMMGHKWEYFVLSLSFILWILLVAVTWGLASFYVYPYMQTTLANFYERLKAEHEGNTWDSEDLSWKAESAAEDVIAESRKTDK